MAVSTNLIYQFNEFNVFAVEISTSFPPQDITALNSLSESDTERGEVHLASTGR